MARWVFWAVSGPLFLLIIQRLLFQLVDSNIISRIEKPPKSEFSLVEIELVPGQDSSRSKAEGYSCSSGIDIIFVHGLGSNPDTTWGIIGTSQPPKFGDSGVWYVTDCWITHFLPDDLPQETLAHTRAFFYNYDSYWYRDALDRRLWDLGERLLFHIGSEIQQCEKRRLVFVAFSYGGLVVKQALVRAKSHEKYSALSKNTEGVIFLGAPHRGSDVTPWGLRIARVLRLIGSNPSILEGLQYDALPLRNLHTEFMGAYGTSLKLINFFEERPTRFLDFGFMKWEEFVVRQPSATFDSPGVQNIGLPVDHSGLNKFKSRSIEYKLVLNALVSLIEESRHIVQHHLDDSVLQSTVSVYVERDVLSRMLESKLQALKDGSDILHAVILYGLGGSGKSQLVLRYVETHRRRYSHIFWVDAATKESTFESFRVIGQDLKLGIYEKSDIDPQEPVLENRVILEVLKWFRQASGKEADWLVIIDNADDLTWGIESLIPRGAKGSIIITTRNVDFTNLLTNVESLAVGNMEVEEVISLLLKGVDLELENAPTGVLAIARSIAEALDYLPLALDLARAYVADVRRTETAEKALSTYLKDFQRHQDEILGDKTLSRMSNLAVVYEDRGRWKDAQEIFDLVRDKRLKSLGKTNEYTLTSMMNSAVSLLKQKRLDEAEQDMLEVLELDKKVFGDYHYFTITTMLNLAQVYAHQYRFQEAEELSSHVAKFREETLGLNHPDTLAIKINLVALYLDEGRLGEAEILLNYDLEAAGNVLGEQHPTLMRLQAMRVKFHELNGRWEEAEQLQVQLVENRTAILGPQHPQTV
ncbi:hypothetical protein NA56DRAFT_605582, partial [Hyaloscypha hepaticicola]